MENNFKIVFDLLEKTNEPASSPAIQVEIEKICNETSEISELCKLSLAISEPEIKTFTIT